VFLFVGTGVGKPDAGEKLFFFKDMVLHKINHVGYALVEKAVGKFIVPVAVYPEIVKKRKELFVLLVYRFNSYRITFVPLKNVVFHCLLLAFLNQPRQRRARARLCWKIDLFKNFCFGQIPVTSRCFRGPNPRFLTPRFFRRSARLEKAVGAWDGQGLERVQGFPLDRLFNILTRPASVLPLSLEIL
jgi:hypothetical protein